MWGKRRVHDGGYPSVPFESAAASQGLAAAGQRAGGTGDISGLEEILKQSGFRLHDASRQFLREYHGLAFHAPITGADGVKGFVHFAPEMVLRLLGTNDLPRIAALMPKAACPVGTTSGHTIFLFLDEDGHSYLLDMEWCLFAKLASTIAEMVQVLSDGRNGRVDSYILDEQGRRTVEMIRKGNERQYWQLDKFPRVAPYLPQVSLCPARRPPTWGAMVQAAEATLAARGTSPDALMITCGGFASSPSGQTFFVAHCENSLYVRAKAGFHVTGPPPGIAPRFHVGEVIPFQPPPGW